MTKKQRKTLVRIIASMAVAAISFLLSHYIPTAVTACLFILAYLTAGYDIVEGAFRNITRGRVFDEKLLMTLATAGAIALGEYAEAAGVMIFYQIGELFQSMAVGKSRRSIAQLMDIRPDCATVVHGGEEITLSPDEVLVGEIITVRPGEKIPLDGEITEGTTSVNAAALTGESLPLEKAPGDRVISGSINLSSLIKVKVDSPYSQSTVSKILELVGESTLKKAPAENFITRFARIYTPCVVVSALLLALIPTLFFNGSWQLWLERALIFLMVSCPCALVVSVPLSFFGGIGRASRKGILIKGSAYMEVLANTDTVVFDKTGTITEGSFTVEAVHPTETDESRLLSLAAAAEGSSNHPIARSVVTFAGGNVSAPQALTEIPGMGVSAVIEGKTFHVGNTALMKKVGAQVTPCPHSGAVVHISEGDRYLGHIGVSDKIKSDSKSAISELKSLGIKETVMLTGDSREAAATAAEAVGIDRYYSSMLPQDKVNKVEALINMGRKVAFVGDGINDAPVLALSHVGIAMGAMGSDAAIEAADIVLMDDKPGKLPAALKICKKTLTIVRQNIVFALGVKLLILVLTALGFTNMWTAVFGDVGVMVLAIANALRLISSDK